MIDHTKKVAIFADLHLGVHQNSSNWQQIALNFANWLKIELQERNISNIIFCGDWFHYRDEINVSTLGVSSRILDILSDFNITMIPGNHDCYLKNEASINSLAAFKGRHNITVFDTMEVINRHHHKMVFVPWGVPISSIPDNIDIVFGHFELSNFRINNYKICDHGEDHTELINRSKLTFSGHFHLCQEKLFQQSSIIYIGNPFQMDFGDCERSKFVYIYDFETKLYDRIENTASPKHHLVKISTIQNNIIPQEIKDIIPGNIIKLSVDAKVTPDYVGSIQTKLSQMQPLLFTTDYKVNLDDFDVNSFTSNADAVNIEHVMLEFLNNMDIDAGIKPKVVKYMSELYKNCL